MADETKTTDLQIRVPYVLAREWRIAARAMGMPVGAWIRLQIAGNKPAQAPVEAKEGRPLWQRIDGAIADPPHGGVLNRREAATLAKRLGVSRRAVEGSLGSMVASKRLVREGDVYRRVER